MEAKYLQGQPGDCCQEPTSAGNRWSMGHQLSFNQGQGLLSPGSGLVEQPVKIRALWIYFISTGSVKDSIVPLALLLRGWMSIHHWLPSPSHFLYGSDSG